MTTPARFLERWSRLKRRGDSGTASAAGAPDQTAPGEEASTPAPGSPHAEAGELDAGAARGADAPVDPGAVPSLPPIDTLDLDADFTAFLKKEVGEPLRRAALRKLFSDPHFNRMDGLDTYIADYSVADPIPPDVMKRLRQFRNFFGDEQEEDGRTAAPVEPIPGPGAAEPDPGAGAGVVVDAELETGADPAPAVSADDPLSADGPPDASCTTATADEDTGNARPDR
ncbi:DUF3306 domain-containing protein [Aromatoleum aromaticum]|uniref:DUF3306 domain-containing protein n=1 Tax=Aromatoleum aromaticum (strain DSM 19018 / LMG 30748 / EbN1) TaxID=76114 RepID=Q5P4I4_AROAE|nr:DUF3306 domain-containing protein [Aromatoleum aromaticum]NMG53554.1 DUF3306 domain-containing protein [Aromatoleum aromaticum]CAI07779.1 hypothetical protein ebA2941 [Aromatoleum aromaticum EbN1]